MGTLTPARDSIPSRGTGQVEFLPRESPMEMLSRPLGQFQRQEPALRSTASAPALAPFASRSTGLRRACIFAGTAVLTVAGCYEMYEVLQVGGITVLESIVLGLFVLLFAWVAFSFMSSLAGFCVLLFRRPDGLGIDPGAALPAISIRTAMLLPTYNEDPDRILARLRAICESVEETGSALQFDWFVLSDTTDPATWIAEEQAFLQLRRDLAGVRLFYRHRPENTARKSGNIGDWVKRFGADYECMIILDADSLMAGDAVVRLVAAMERHPQVALIQTLPLVVNARTRFARLQQF